MSVHKDSDNRLVQCFDRLREQGRKAFVAYITAGDPDLGVTEQLIPALDKAGVDVIELGVPYSDPMADGPAIQMACERALASGTSVPGVLASVAAIRKHSQVPILLFTYVSPIEAYGVERFARDAARAGIDGLLLLDLPPEEDHGVFERLRAGGLATVCLIAPNTEDARRSMLAQESRGFVYYVCRFGVTGERSDLPKDLKRQIAAIKRGSSVPVCIGFGISSPEQAALAAKHGDGVVVGSHLVRMIERDAGKKSLVANVAKRAKQLAAAVHAV
ncbi:MAG: tryptophan synthase subunit alpha [Planctomycetota bacterium]|nr:tryptophan synthase subunit alpha [Planctomycetota bacterium]